ncbi:hypothetical protein HYH03_012318 [Edaphochlamys debaryana]|uniref:Protein kinase domain-containing protein n=1 Tax=Edaphochlamys debaryana TaxID=47281 RepID=A0A835XQ73_9CHLO|nr:hypothetical protein HYH03_012318 [Edaphochlamys debaryana]|eukprot:KAG2489092.1 hypothetical protein HYH03_012318 [Edaphochlamys debaryana]
MERHQLRPPRFFGASTPDDADGGAGPQLVQLAASTAPGTGPPWSDPATLLPGRSFPLAGPGPGQAAGATQPLRSSSENPSRRGSAMPHLMEQAMERRKPLLYEVGRAGPGPPESPGEAAPRNARASLSDPLRPGSYKCLRGLDSGGGGVGGRLPPDCAAELAALPRDAAPAAVAFAVLPLSYGRRMAGALWIVVVSNPGAEQGHVPAGLELLRNPSSLAQLSTLVQLSTAAACPDPDYVAWAAGAARRLAASTTLHALVSGTCTTVAQHVRRCFHLPDVAVQSALLPDAASHVAFMLCVAPSVGGAAGPPNNASSGSKDSGVTAGAAFEAPRPRTRVPPRRVASQMSATADGEPSSRAGALPRRTASYRTGLGAFGDVASAAAAAVAAGGSLVGRPPPQSPGGACASVPPPAHTLASLMAAALRCNGSTGSNVLLSLSARAFHTSHTVLSRLAADPALAPGPAKALLRAHTSGEDHDALAQAQAQAQHAAHVPVGIVIPDTAKHIADVLQPSRDVILLVGSKRAAAAPGVAWQQPGGGSALDASAGTARSGSVVLLGLGLGGGGCLLGLYIALPLPLPGPLLEAVRDSARVLLERVVLGVFRHKLQFPEIAADFDTLRAGVPGSYLSMARLRATVDVLGVPEAAPTSLFGDLCHAEALCQPPGPGALPATPPSARVAHGLAALVLDEEPPLPPSGAASGAVAGASVGVGVGVDGSASFTPGGGLMLPAFGSGLDPGAGLGPGRDSVVCCSAAMLGSGASGVGSRTQGSRGQHYSAVMLDSATGTVTTADPLLSGLEQGTEGGGEGGGGAGLYAPAGVMTVHDVEYGWGLRGLMGALVESVMTTLRQSASELGDPLDGGEAGSRISEALEDLLLSEVVGHGASGVVLRGVLGTVPVAVKLVEMADVDKESPSSDTHTVFTCTTADANTITTGPGGMGARTAASMALLRTPSAAQAAGGFSGAINGGPRTLVDTRDSSSLDSPLPPAGVQYVPAFHVSARGATSPQQEHLSGLGPSSEAAALAVPERAGSTSQAGVEGGGSGPAPAPAAVRGPPGRCQRTESQQLHARRKMLRSAMELAVMRSIQHVHIVQAHAVFDNVVMARRAGPAPQAPGGGSIQLKRLDPRTHGPGDSPICTAVVQELCDRGSLADVLSAGSFPRHVLGPRGTPLAGLPCVDMQGIYLTLLEIAQALRHLHSKRLVHRDLKPANVLLKSNPADPRGWTCKLADFGLALVLDKQEMMMLAPPEPDPALRGNASGSLGSAPAGGRIVGVASLLPSAGGGVLAPLSNPSTPSLPPSLSPSVAPSVARHWFAVQAQASGTVTHMAPEAMLRNSRIDASVDVFSFGVIMWELLCGGGNRPYDKLHPSDIPKAVKAGLRPVFTASVPRAYRQLAISCWSSEPHRRPRASELVAAVKAQLGQLAQQQLVRTHTHTHTHTHTQHTP